MGSADPGRLRDWYATALDAHPDPVTARRPRAPTVTPEDRAARTPRALWWPLAARGGTGRVAVRV